MVGTGMIVSLVLPHDLPDAMGGRVALLSLCGGEYLL